jgi:hypothetical protein
LSSGRSPSSSSNDEKRYVEKLKIIASAQMDSDFANDLLVLPKEMFSADSETGASDFES